MNLIKTTVTICALTFPLFSMAQNNPINFSRTNLSVNKKFTGLSAAEASQKALNLFSEKRKSIAGLPTANDFKLIQQRQGLTGGHIQFQERINGLPVYGSYTTVHVNPDSSIDDIEVNNALIKKSMDANSFTQNEKTATQHATDSVGSTPTSIPQIEKNLYMDNGDVRRAWKVEFQTQRPSRTWRILVDDESGKILEKRDLNFYAEGKGWVFNPNPVVTSGLLNLGDNINQDSSTLTAERQQVVLKNLDGSGTLSGKYVKINSPKANNVNLVFDFTRSQTEFEETMAYYHIDTMQNYIQSLGFSQINNRVVYANINATPDDNSFYSPSTKEITFGSGGVDDAEDADIIYHEMGHAMQDNQVPNFGNSHEGGSMGEGFGDYWAASAFEGVGPLKHTKDIFVGTWDAVAYNPAKGSTPAFLRRLDTTKKYPKDMAGEVHDDGEIWSACLWQIHVALGKKKADTLILESHFYLTANSGFVDGANALLKADAKLFKGQNAKTITKVFKARGILK